MRHAATGLTIALAATVLLSGCAAGQHAATVEEVPTADGVSADNGNIGIRDTAIAAPGSGSYGVGKNAPLQLVIVNNGAKDDQLTAVSSSLASLVLLSPPRPSSASSSSS